MTNDDLKDEKGKDMRCLHIKEEHAEGYSTELTSHAMVNSINYCLGGYWKCECITGPGKENMKYKEMPGISELRYGQRSLCS